MYLYNLLIDSQMQSFAPTWALLPIIRFFVVVEIFFSGKQIKLNNEFGILNQLGVTFFRYNKVNRSSSLINTNALCFF